MLPRWIVLLSSSLEFLKSITLGEFCCIHCSAPRDTKGVKIYLSAGLGVFFCFHLPYWSGDANLLGRLWVCRAWVPYAENICSIGLWNPQAWCPSGWGELAENRTGLCQNPAYPLLEVFLKAAYFREMFCFVDSAFWQTDAETENLQPNLVITTWLHLKHLRNLPRSSVVFLEVTQDSFSHS